MPEGKNVFIGIVKKTEVKVKRFIVIAPHPKNDYIYQPMPILLTILRGYISIEVQSDNSCKHC